MALVDGANDTLTNTELGVTDEVSSRLVLVIGFGDKAISGPRDSFSSESLEEVCVGFAFVLVVGD